MNPTYIKEEIHFITTQLVEKYHPEKIILFGSATGKNFNKEESDLDFLIIKKEVPILGRERIYQLDKLISYRIATDFIVYTPEEIDHLCTLHDQFIDYILKKGKILYERQPALSTMD